MKILAYRVKQYGEHSFSELLALLDAMPIEDRTFAGKASGLRLEELGSGSPLFADFAVKRHGHGPGKISDKAKISPISLADGEFFGEDTGLLFHEETSTLVVQYNHSGPRLTRIQHYLRKADLHFAGRKKKPRGEVEEKYGFGFGAILKPGAISKIRKMGLVREFEFEIAVPELTSDDRAAGKSLGKVLSAPLPDGIERLKVSMIANSSRGSHMNRSVVMGYVDDLLQAGSLVQQAKLKGKEFDLAQTEDLSLLEEQLVMELPISVGAGGRISQADRWGGLRRALDTWLANKAIT